MKDREYVVTSNIPLLSFLNENIADWSKKTIKNYLVHGSITVNEKVTTKYNFELRVGDIVKVHTSKRMTDKKDGLQILYEDRDLIVVNKPPGMLTVATENEREKTLYHLVRENLKKRYSNAKVFIVHRLDRDTSGIVLFAKSEIVKKILQDNWSKTVLRRGYLALVEGHMKEKEGVIHTYLKEDKNYRVYSVKNAKGGKEAITKYQVVKEKGANTLVALELKTGRKNQIRVHMSEMGHPIVGDKKYGAKKKKERMMLHAYELSLIHPKTKKNLKIKTEIPKEFQ